MEDLWLDDVWVVDGVLLMGLYRCAGVEG